MSKADLIAFIESLLIIAEQSKDKAEIIEHIKRIKEETK